MSHRLHAFVCTQSRPEGHPRGCCTSRGGGQPLFDRLMQNMMSKNLWDQGISIAQSSCLGFCGYGPVMVIYPEGIWYQPTKAEDIDEIVDTHFVGGKVVERLRVSPVKK
ncbi:MAG: (2Fe-2S) ferredoxin domain-containing protein [Magnetospirillum sp.]|nr:(2Fe-2S) ferredoxin domain-containing protein [Magnetospirillum sp.]